MALDTRLGIDLVRLQLQYHRDSGIRYFLLLLPGNNGNEDSSTVYHELASDEVVLCQQPAPGLTPQQRRLSLFETCQSQRASGTWTDVDWLIENSGSDFWLADGSFAQCLRSFENNSQLSSDTFLVIGEHSLPLLLQDSVSDQSQQDCPLQPDAYQLDELFKHAICQIAAQYLPSQNLAQDLTPRQLQRLDSLGKAVSETPPVCEGLTVLKVAALAYPGLVNTMTTDENFHTCGNDEIARCKQQLQVVLNPVLQIYHSLSAGVEASGKQSAA